MEIKILHYEPESDEPYSQEVFTGARSFQFDTKEKTVFFIKSDGESYHAEYNHHLVIEISNGASELGRIGGSRNTPAQNAARAANAKHAGRPKGSKNKPKENHD